MAAPGQRRRTVVTLLRRSAIAFAALGVIGGIVYAALPTRVAVDMAQVQAGSLEVTVREEGKTRIRERYVVSSPLAGRVLRISLDPGDEVAANETVLATIEPADPSLLDARSVAQSQAKVQASEAARHRAEADLKRSEASFERAKSNFQRVQSLRESRAASTEQLEDADLELTAASEQLAAARFNVNIAEFEWQQARAALTHFQPGETADPTQDWRMQVRSPISGRVLRVYQESAAVLVAGTPLVEVGDSSDLEVVVDVLSEDAVRVTPGDAVRIEQWGGGRSLPGRVRLVEPQAFTKVSALGVEEQRVNLVIDFTGPKEDRGVLGDGFRVEANVIVWRGEDVLKVPVSCLFRLKDEWYVFVVRDGRAELRPIELAEKNNLEAAVTKGLEPGELVIVHPGDQVKAATQVVAREE